MEAKKKKKLTTAELTEISTAARMAELLAARVLEDQRNIAFMLAQIEAMTWPENILGQMQDYLERRDYEKIENMLREWEKFRQSDLPQVQEIMEKTATLIQGFVEFFKQTNGIA